MKRAGDGDDEFPTRTLVARVMRSERVGPPPYGRTSFEFDAIDARVSADDVERVIDDERDIKPFAALRVVTTASRFGDLFGFVPSDGMWVELFIRPRSQGPGPIAFHAQLDADGYTEHTRGVLGEARLLYTADEPPVSPLSLGAAVPAAVQLAGALVAKCQFPAGATGARRRVAAILHGIQDVERIRVRDVGQANFVSLLSASGRCLAHFDAGWPISFNGHTCPATPPTGLHGAPVILSHWDWDHLHAYYRCQELRLVNWITPIQTLGPGARKIASQLHRAGLLHGYAGAPCPFPSGILVPCTGPSHLNDNGLALHLTLRSGKQALLIGDAGYGTTGAVLHGATYDFLVVTHHGAEFVGPPPIPAGPGTRGIVSVGRRNVYQHPRAAAMRRHAGAGWTLSRTSSHGARARGDRFLGP